jgi:hypothetical protein
MESGAIQTPVLADLEQLLEPLDAPPSLLLRDRTSIWAALPADGAAWAPEDEIERIRQARRYNPFLQGGPS